MFFVDVDGDCRCTPGTDDPGYTVTAAFNPTQNVPVDVPLIDNHMAQSARDHVMESFRRERADVLVATNVAARGLDVSHVGLVINYDLPDTADALTHRIGRTARNGNTGRALTFITAEDHENWAKLRRQGAPMLRTVDASLLVKDGHWLYVDEPAHQSRPARAQSASRRRRSSRPLGRRRVHLD